MPTRRPPTAQTLRFRAQLPAFTAQPAPEPAYTFEATHDFLVPNPRPDLAPALPGARHV